MKLHCGTDFVCSMLVDIIFSFAETTFWYEKPDDGNGAHRTDIFKNLFEDKRADDNHGEEALF